MTGEKPMLKGNRDLHESYMRQMVSNVTCDEAAFNTTYKAPFHSWAEAYSFLLEEVQETEEALQVVNKELKSLWDSIRENKPSEELAARVEVLRTVALQMVHEAIHVTAVAKKATDQLENKGKNNPEVLHIIAQIKKAPTSGN